jgi:hypothetical protein
MRHYKYISFAADANNIYQVSLYNDKYAIALIKQAKRFSKVITIYDYSKFIFLAAPLNTKMLDINIYNYIHARFQQLAEFNQEMQVDYLQLRSDDAKTILGIAYDPNNIIPNAIIDIDYLSLYRFILSIDAKLIVAPSLVICIDVENIFIAGYGSGLWGYCKNIKLVEVAIDAETAMQQLLNTNPAKLNNINVTTYVIAAGGFCNLPQIDNCHLIDPNMYINTIDLHISNRVIFTAGSSLWGKI